jgi:hypothetical protein
MLAHFGVVYFTRTTPVPSAGAMEQAFSNKKFNHCANLALICIIVYYLPELNRGLQGLLLSLCRVDGEKRPRLSASACRVEALSEAWSAVNKKSR